MSNSDDSDVGVSFKESVQTIFAQLRERGLDANCAASQALKIARQEVESLPDIQSVLEALQKPVEGTGLTSPAWELLSEAFSSPEVLIASFGRVKDSSCPMCHAQQHEHSAQHSTVNGEKHSSSQVQSKEVLELDMAQIDQLYAAIVEADACIHREFKHIFAEFIDVLQSSPREYTWQLVGAALQNPLLEDPDNGWLLHELIDSIHSWDEESDEHAMVNMLASFPQERFEGTLQVLQTYITLAILEEGRVNGAMQSALELMAFYHRANQRVHHVPLSAFYNDAVNDDELFERIMPRDLKIWEEGGVPDPDHACSLIRFAFIYDPGSKAQLLGASHARSQWLAFQRAFFESATQGGAMPYMLLRVRRGQHLVHDTLLQIQNAGLNVRKPLKVQFFGEEGVDEGGVQKELFQLLMRELFDADFGMFTMDPVSRTYYFRASGLDMNMEFELVGLLLGLAIYNQHILEVSLPMAIYKLLMRRQLGLEDLKDVHPEIYNSLKRLLVHEGDVAEMGLYFQVEQERDFGEGTTAVDLVEGGDSKAVTNENRAQFVEVYVEHLLLKSVEKQRNAFCRGFHKMWRDNELLMHLFEPEELEALVCGGTDLDFGALQQAARYEAGFEETSEVIVWFWEAVHGFTEAQRKRLLAFMTGSDRVPIRGLASLQPPFVISRNGPASDRLPTAHTCFNHLLLPAYADKATLQNRLETAINNAEGFGLR